jgi:hypothetical protein
MTGGDGSIGANRGMPGTADSDAAPGGSPYGQWCDPERAGVLPDEPGTVPACVVDVAAVSRTCDPLVVPLLVAATAATDPTPAMATAATPVASALRRVKRLIDSPPVDHHPNRGLVAIEPP